MRSHDVDPSTERLDHLQMCLALWLVLPDYISLTQTLQERCEMLARPETGME